MMTLQLGLLINVSISTQVSLMRLLKFLYIAVFGRVTRNGQVADIAQQLRFILMETGFDEIGVITKPMYLGKRMSVSDSR